MMEIIAIGIILIVATIFLIQKGLVKPDDNADCIKKNPVFFIASFISILIGVTFLLIIIFRKL